MQRGSRTSRFTKGEGLGWLGTVAKGPHNQIITEPFLQTEQCVGKRKSMDKTHKVRTNIGLPKFDLIKILVSTDSFNRPILSVHFLSRL